MKSILTCLVILISVVSLGAVKFRCDYMYNNNEVGWLKYHDIPAVWADARLRCRHEGAMLASPTSNAIRTAMKNTISKIDIFTGFHATVSQGDFHSIDGKSLEDISHVWTEEEPDNKDNAESCISMNLKGKISDVRCDKPRPYICHRPFSLVGTNFCGTLDPEYQFDTRTSKCYKFHTTPRTFKRAHFVCNAEGGHLGIINSDVESQVIREIFARNPPHIMIGNFMKDVAFMGFHNYGESADWTTIDGQTLKEAGFDKFEPGEPNNSTAGQYCGAVGRSGLLHDMWCEEHFAFICEKSPTHPKVCETEHSDEVDDIDVRTSD